MGNYRFRLSDMIPNVWFYKLKGVGRTRRNHSSGGGGSDDNNNTWKKQNHGLVSPPASKSKQPQGFYPRKSYYFTRELVPGDFPDTPRKLSKQRSGKINPRKSTSGESSNLQEELRSDCILTTEFSCKLMNSKPDDKSNVSDLKVELPPIKCRRSSVSVSVVKEETITVKDTKKKNSSGVRKITVNSPGVRLRVNSPRIASRRIQARRSVSSSISSLSGSFAVVKSSSNPQRDFR